MNFIKKLFFKNSQIIDHSDITKKINNMIEAQNINIPKEEKINNLNVKEESSLLNDIKNLIDTLILDYGSNLQEFYFNEYFNCELNEIKIPNSVKKIYLGPKYRKSFENVKWPSNLEHLIIDSDNFPRLESNWPNKLTLIQIGKYDKPKKPQISRMGYGGGGMLQLVAYGAQDIYLTCDTRKVLTHNREFNSFSDTWEPQIELKFDNFYDSYYLPNGLEVLRINLLRDSLQNLPVTLKKIILTDTIKNKKNIKKSKIPFGCEVTYSYFF